MNNQNNEFDATLQRNSAVNPRLPNYIPGVQFDALLDETTLNRIIRPKNLAQTPQGNEPAKMYWDINIPTLKIWINSTLGWFDVLNRPYGSMYIYTLGGPGPTINCAVTQTFYEVDNGVSSGPVNGFTFQNGKSLVCPINGTYLVNWSMALSAGANTEVEGTIMINGVADTQFACHAIIPSANKDVGVSGTGIVSLTQGQLISLAVMNESGTGNVTVDHLTCSATLVAITT